MQGISVFTSDNTFMLALSITGLQKKYSNNYHALKGITLSVEQGDFFALLGPNGAGKTTLIGIVSSLVNKTEGKVLVFGKDIEKEPEQVKSYIGLVPQEFNFLLFDNVFQLLIMQAGFYGIPKEIAKERAERYLKKLGLWDKRNGSIRMLSGGMKRRLMIARALMHEPKLLILDEPTAGVDIEIRRTMWDFLRELNKRGTTIILTTHYLEEAETLCRNIAIINRGEVIENTKMSLLLSQLAVETFVFYLKDPLATAPAIPSFTCRLIDEITLEVDLTERQSIDDLFIALRQQHIQIMRMKNKSNRLEELFIQMIGDH